MLKRGGSRVKEERGDITENKASCLYRIDFTDLIFRIWVCSIRGHCKPEMFIIMSNNLNIGLLHYLLQGDTNCGIDFGNIVLVYHDRHPEHLSSFTVSCKETETEV